MTALRCRHRHGRIAALALLACMTALPGARAADSVTAGPGPGPGPGPGQGIQPLRFNDDFSYLADPRRSDDFWDTLKWIPLGDGARLNLGGEVRERYQYYKNPVFGLTGVGTESFVLSRLLAHADLRFENGLRAFLQFGEHEAPNLQARTTTDVDRLDVQQAFLDFTTAGDYGKFTLRLGRHEMSYGVQRILSARETPNLRRSFDGGRVDWAWPGVQVAVFAGRPVNNKFGPFNDSLNPIQSLWGSYATVANVLPGTSADFYYFGFRNTAGTYAGKTGTDLRHSVGARLFGKHEPWDWDVEAVLQAGHFRNEEVRAFLLASYVGYTLADVPWRPRLSLQVDVASGDGNPNDKTNNTYNPIFPTGSYFTQAQINAPSNVMSLFPRVQVQPVESLLLTAGVDLLWRYSRTDAFYRQPFAAVAGTAASRGKYLGTQSTVQADWTVDRHLSITTAYVRFEVGGTFDTVRGRDTDYFGAWFQYKF
ncbi:MAG: hypothetical protein JWM77_1545 [Rhodospirillales bacterium]|nr:hypothetical protein [Rhodospirillales bacterium]